MKKESIKGVCHECLESLPWKVLQKVPFGRLFRHTVYMCKNCIKKLKK